MSFIIYLNLSPMHSVQLIGQEFYTFWPCNQAKDDQIDIKQQVLISASKICGQLICFRKVYQKSKPKISNVSGEYCCLNYNGSFSKLNGTKQVMPFKVIGKLFIFKIFQIFYNLFVFIYYFLYNISTRTSNTLPTNNHN